MGNQVITQPSNQQAIKSNEPCQMRILVDEDKNRNATLDQIKNDPDIFKEYKLNKTFYIGYSNTKDIICKNSFQQFQKQKQKMNNWLFVKIQNGKIIIDADGEKEQDNLVSQILPQNCWHQLNKNDKFKIGRSIFRFIESGEYNKFKKDKKNKTSKLVSLIASQKNINLKEQCKICFEDVQTQQNPLISPCSCSGSIQNIHLQCLNRFLFQSKQIGDKIIQIQSKKVICSICKEEFSQKNKYYDQIISSLLENQNKWKSESQNQKNIAVLEVLLQNKMEEHKRTFYIISFKQQEILQFGRNSSFADLTQDGSISRVNTSLKFENSKVKIRDQNSRNGTGVLVKFPYECNLKSDKIFRTGKKLFKISGKQNK